MARAPRKSRIHGCNVLVDLAGRTRWWSFAGSEARPAGSFEQAVDQPLPARAVGKGWSQLIRPRLNIAWLHESPVFVQLVHLPTDDPAEVPAMLELQIEKLSPMPVGQVVWSHEVLPQRGPAGLPVLLLVAERDGVESLLSRLEGRGFLVDRIETPLLTLLARTTFPRDGAYVFLFRLGERPVCLAGWVAEGALRVLNRVNFTDDDRWAKQVSEELHRLAWAGELEGWAGPFREAHLVADEGTLGEWREPIERALGMTVHGIPSPGDAVLAGFCAGRAAKGQGQGNLLPSEFAARYRQQQTDRLWMGGLGAVFGAYLVAVLLYFGAVEVQKFRYEKLAQEVASVSAGFTNTLRIRAQAQVLQETVNLRFAALDCWLATVESMPEELALESLAFSGGQSVVISGNAPVDQEPRITEFWAALRRKVVGNTNLFSEVQLRPTVVRSVRGQQQIQWSFHCRLQRQEI
ncbi:MAG: hypothetical protein KF833_22565 [Verrucomicrobiae bacterium]|nr:hypothetical protein [Verrucomicrobiae bacterium]